MTWVNRVDSEQENPAGESSLRGDDLRCEEMTDLWSEQEVIQEIT